MNRIALVLLACAVVASGCRPATDDEPARVALNTVIEAEAMASVGRVEVEAEASASGGEAVAFRSAGSLRASFHGAVTQILLRARAGQCEGTPLATVLIDGIAVHAVDVAERSMAHYGSSASIGPGEHLLEVRYVDEGKAAGCTQELFLDYVALEVSQPDGSQSVTPPPPPPPPPPDSVFTLVAMPDTQRETNAFPDRFLQRMKWLVDNRARLDVRFMVQVGDLVDWDTPDHIQYVRASEGAKLLDEAHLPYAIAVGNHDTAAVCPGGSACPGKDARVTVRVTTTINQYFPPTRFQKLRGIYEAGKMDNGFHLFTAGGLEWLVLNLELWPRSGAVAWAKKVVAEHPRHNVIVVTHSHLNSTGGIEQTNGGYGANSPQYVYDNLLKLYPNIRMVFSGHTGGAGYRVDTGIEGNKIYQFLQTYHDTRTNPLRLLELDTAAGTIKTRVYAPLTNEQKNDGSAFTVTGVSWVR